MPSWSASTYACSNSDASAVLAKIRQYILPAPDSPEHRWMVSKAGEGWKITEYSGLRVFIRCQAVSKADELNGVQHGNIEFQNEASRTTRFPELTSAGLQWSEWSEWTDFLKPLEKTQEAELPPLMMTMYRLALAADSRDRHIPFRKYKGNFQLEWEYDRDSQHPTLMPSADVNRFFTTAETEAAKLRIEDTEQARRAPEEAEFVGDASQVRDAQHMGAPAKIRSTVDPDQFYPSGAKRREEQGSPVVQACVGASGKLVREPVVTETSGFPELDGAAVQVAKANRYMAATVAGTALPESCVKFKIRFVIKAN